MHFTDAVTISGTHKREDGYLVVDARIARTGVQRYLGSEVGQPEKAFVDVYRSPEEVFSADAMASFAHRPVTDDHPTVAVTADNWKTLAVGQTDGDIRQEDRFLRVPLMIADAATIAKVESGKRELSAGYTCQLDMTPGVTPEGETYDAIQKNIRSNHVAIVAAGRAGKECRIGDGSSQIWGSSPVTTQQKDSQMSDLRNVMVDGLPIQTTDAGAMAIDRLTADKATLTADVAGLRQQLADMKKANEEELAKKDAAIVDAQSKILDQVGIDKLVSDRVALETSAKTLVPDLKTAGLSDHDVRKAVVTAKLGDNALKSAEGRDQAYQVPFVDALFDKVVIDASKTDQFRDTSTTPITPGAAPANMNDAFAKREAAFAGLMHFDQYGQEKGV